MAAATLAQLRALPDIAPLLADVDLGHDMAIPTPFLASADGGGVTIGAGAGNAEASLAMALRHGLETALWLRLAGPNPGRPRCLAAALLAGRCAAVALASRGEAERVACRPLFDPDLELLLGAEHPPVADRRLCALASRLLAAQSGDNGPVAEAELTDLLTQDWFVQAWTLALPVEVLLTADGDTRLRLDPESGLNRYGCSPRPRPQALTFASTTATSISDEAFARAEALRRRLAGAAMAGRLDQACAEAKAEIRTELARRIGAPATTGIVLAPSGTDAELHALQLALAADGRPLTTIVIAPRETGSTVVPAASGRHHNATTSQGEAVTPGEPVDAATAARVELKAVALRDEAGEVLAPERIDAAVTTLAEAAIAAGRRVLLHVLDTSKTGLVAPGLATVLDLARRFAGDLDVVVDAAQLRLGPAMVAAYLDQGFMLIVTGSKFFTGPPFAGALLVPPAIAARAKSEASLPAGYGAYSDRECWPGEWIGFRRGLPQRPGLGLIMRWRAALWEMEAFQAVPAATARHILATFLSVVGAAIAASPHLRLLPVRRPDRRPLDDGRGWDGLATIHTFALLHPTSGAPLDLDLTKRVYDWLNRDVSAALPAGAIERERDLAALSAHIGQPVLVAGTEADGLCGLRLAAGARLVSVTRFAADPASVRSLLEREIFEARQILAKTEVLLAYLDHLLAVI